MKGILYLLFAVILNFLLSCTGSITDEHQPEASDPKTIDQSIWTGVTTGLNGSFGSIDVPYSKSYPPSEGLKDTLSLWGWKGEKVHGQLLLWSKEEITGLSVKAGSIEGEKGVIDKYNIDVRMVKYVLSDEFINGCGRRDRDTIPVHISPDILDPFGSIDIKSQETRPIWISILIPDEAPRGSYHGDILVTLNDDTLKYPVSLLVTDQTLPPPSEWKFHLDLWQNPWAVARYNNIEPWSEDHWNQMKPLYRLLAQAGQKCITTTLNDMPWGGQTYDPFESMVGWLRNSDGSWDYDFSLFDQFVNFMMECGISEQINCYSMVPWNNRFLFFDQDEAKFIELQAVPGTEEYNALWEPFLYQFREHLREMGWLNITTIAMDERKREDMLAILSLLNRTVPEIKITLAGEIQEGVDEYIYDLSIAIANDPTVEEIASRVNNGRPTTFYTCCARPEHPNNFTFSPPADNSFIGWYAAS